MLRFINSINNNIIIVIIQTQMNLNIKKLTMGLNTKNQLIKDTEEWYEEFICKMNMMKDTIISSVQNISLN